MSTNVAAGPAWIAILRHAEKPGDPATDNLADGPDLSDVGQQRAALLATALPDIVGATPDRLFAAQASAESNRPVETITPLANALGVGVAGINTKFKNKQFQELAAHLLNDPKYRGLGILICWHHGNIPNLAHALGATDAPSEWHGEVFDRVWKITYSSGQPDFTDLPQKLLPGDSTA
jgi:broad specificity phosphatase PhoE